MAESAAQELVGGSLPVGVNILLAQAQDPITASCDQYHSEMSPAALKDSNEGLYSPTLSSPKRQRTSTRKARASWQYEQLEDEPDEEEKEEMAKEEELQTGLPLLEMPFDVLTRVLSRLPLNLLLQASAASKMLAQASEVVFERECKAKHWLPPRRPRGSAAEIKCFPWRSLYRRHACQACGQSGEFPVRVNFLGTVTFLVCKRCATTAWVRERLVKRELFVDLVGISGKRLLRKGQKTVRYRQTAAHT